MLCSESNRNHNQNYPLSNWATIDAVSTKPSCLILTKISRLWKIDLNDGVKLMVNTIQMHYNSVTLKCIMTNV